MMPLEVIEQAQAELPDWKGGMSVLEVSHRGSDFVECSAQAEQSLRDVMGIPANYKVLFLQGGASGQFAAIPMNLAAADATVDYINTGNWSKKAIGEAKNHCVRVNVAADAGGAYTDVPPESA